MAKSVKLLLTETVEDLGIVGDVVSVKLGYARNFLLPRGFAMQPSEEAMAALTERRKVAEVNRSNERSERQSIIERLESFELVIERACNDLGVLYGGVTQADIAAALAEAGFSVRSRDIRLSQTIKRVDTYEVPLKFAADLETNVNLRVKPDREIELDERVEMEFDEEGELVEPRPARAPEPVAEAAEGDAAPEGAAAE